MSRMLIYGFFLTAVIAAFGVNDALSQTSPKKPAQTGRWKTDSAAYQQILQKVKIIVAKQFGVQPQEVDDISPLSKQRFRADDLDIVEIIMALEDAFNIQITDHDLKGSPKEFSKTVSVKQLADIVAGKRLRK